MGKKGCTAFDIAPMTDNINECALYGHKKVSPASGVPGECFQLGKADEIIIEEEPDIPEIDDGVTHKYKHLGYGMCRGASLTACFMVTSILCLHQVFLENVTLFLVLSMLK